MVHPLNFQGEKCCLSLLNFIITYSSARLIAPILQLAFCKYVEIYNTILSSEPPPADSNLWSPTYRIQGFHIFRVWFNNCLTRFCFEFGLFCSFSDAAQFMRCRYEFVCLVILAKELTKALFASIFKLHISITVFSLQNGARNLLIKVLSLSWNWKRNCFLDGHILSFRFLFSF